MTMKYMLMIQSNQRAWDELAAWPGEDVKRMVGHMEALNRDLTEAGELVEAHGLAGPPAARIVRATDDGDPVVTDGPFSESKEVLAGFWIVDVASPERAVEIAARASAAPGVGGVPTNQPIEVHPVVDTPPEPD
jgi:hypothetical protein